MAYKINVQPADVYFQSDKVLLGDALSQGVPLEHSCKTGTCGVCSAEVISGEIINEDGRVVTTGTILTCQSKASSDAALKIRYHPELIGLKIKTLPCKVSSFEFVTNDIIVIKLRFPPTVNFDYLPGQYVDLSFKGIKRSYSIANANKVSMGLELHIRKVENGLMSDALFSEIENGLLMRIEGPKGTFFIRKGEKPLILVAGGTGIAPIKAMVEDLIAKEDKRDIHIYWGMNSLDNFYLQELTKFSEKKDNLHYIPVLSGNNSWDGRSGFVHEAVCEDFLFMDDFHVYVCGSPIMINKAKVAFKNKGLPDNQFLSDAFIPAN